MHGGAGVRLGQDEPLRVLGPGAHLRGQRGERAGAAPVMAQDAQAGPGHGLQRHPVRALEQVVLPVPQEREVVVGQPAQQRHRLGRRPGSLGGQPVGQPGGLGLHPGVVLHRDPHVVQHPVQVYLQHVHRRAAGPQVDLDVGPGLDHLALVGPAAVQRPGYPVQVARDVPADHELRVDDVVAVEVVPGQLHRDRVDEERHVVGHDVHRGAAGVERGRLGGREHPDQGPALRAVRRQPGLLQRYPGQPVRSGRGQVLGRDVPVVGPEVPQQVPDRGVLGRHRGGQAGRLGQQLVPGINGVAIRCHVRHSSRSLWSQKVPQLPQQGVVAHRHPGAQVRRPG